MKIGIMGAMLEEVAQIKHEMTIHATTTIAERTYYAGTLAGIAVVLVLSRCGKVAAATTATTLIASFAVDFIMFTGVAGAIDTKLNVGDIVIGNGLYQHDMDARPLFPRFNIPLTQKILFTPDATYITHAIHATNAWLECIEQDISHTILARFAICRPQLYIGVIASGDQFISNFHDHDGLKLPDVTVLAVEMEGAAVAQVCDEHGVPYIVLRTISDKADHSAPIDFMSFITEIASHYSAGIVRFYLQMLSNSV